MKTGILVFGLIFSSLSFAGSPKAPRFTVEKRLKKNFLDLVCNPPKGFHFNIDEPMSLELPRARVKSLPMHKAMDEVIFELLMPTPKDTAILSIYVCDDGNTFCEKHSVKTTLPKATATPGPE
jgi:hypothetical protein